MKERVKRMKIAKGSYEFENIVESIRKYSMTRRIIILGTGDFQRDLKAYIIENSGVTDKQITMVAMKGLPEEKKEKLSEYISGDCKPENYIVAAIFYEQWLVDLFEQEGWVQGEDYVYPAHKPLQVMVKANYKDDYGNEVHFEDESDIVDEISCTFKGYDARITVGKGFKAKGKFELICDSNSIVNIGDNVVLGKETFWSAYKESVIDIGSGSTFESGKLVICRNAGFRLGKQATIGNNYWITAHLYTKINIGREFLASSDLHIRTNDGHTIFDIETGKSINVSIEGNKSLCLEIGDHVWAGTRVVIVGNTKMREGTVIGACSFIKGCFPNNCIIAGVPAKVIRENIAWSKENYGEEMNGISEEWIKKTDWELG